jgi:hypothetical protein
MAMRYLHALLEMWADWYAGSIDRQRHSVEEDVRRLGGKVVWEDCT